MRSIKLLIFISSFIIFFSYTTPVKADFSENFDDLSIGTQIPFGNFTNNGNATGTITADKWVTSSRSLQITTQNASNRVLYEFATSSSDTYSFDFYLPQGSNFKVLFGYNQLSLTNVYCNTDGNLFYVDDVLQDLECLGEKWNNLIVEINNNDDEVRASLNGIWSDWENIPAVDNSYARIWFYTDNEDEVVYIDNLQDPGGYTVDPDYDWSMNWIQISDSDPDFTFSVNNNCVIDHEFCRLQYWYNEEAVGGQLFFIYNNGQSKWPSNSATNTEIIWKDGLENYMLLEPQTESTSTPFCIYMIHPDGDVLQCGYNLYWVDSSYFEFEFAEDYLCRSDVCDDLSTSTNWFGLDFGFSLECGGRRLIKYSICPSTSSVEVFQNTVNRWNNIFPYSVFAQMTTSFIDVTATTTSLTFNFTDLLSIEGFDFDLPVLYTGIMTDTWGELWTIIYRIQEWIVYIFGFIYLVMRIGFGITVASVKSLLSKKE